MKLLKLLIPSALTLTVFLLPGCQTSPPPITTLETDELVTVDAVADIYSPILLSRSDVLTGETRAQIEAHNNVYWCANAAKRPLGFDVSVCDA